MIVVHRVMSDGKELVEVRVDHAEIDPLHGQNVGESANCPADKAKFANVSFIKISEDLEDHLSRECFKCRHFGCRRYRKFVSQDKSLGISLSLNGLIPPCPTALDVEAAMIPGTNELGM